MINKIMVPLDGSKLAECALPYVEELGAKLGVEVVLVNVTNRVQGYRVSTESDSTVRDKQLSYESPREWKEDWFIPEGVCSSEDKSSKYLAGISKGLQDKGVKVSTEVICGKPAEELSIYANTSSVDLIVMSSHGRSGPSKWAHGSVAEKVARRVHVPIMMIRAPGCGDL